jgi:ATPase family associated with various cellular activities (AAA)
VSGSSLARDELSLRESPGAGSGGDGAGDAAALLMTTSISVPRGLLDETLCERSTNLAYRLARRLADHASGRHVLETSDWTFDLERFGAAGLAEVRRTEMIEPLFELDFRGLETGTVLVTKVAWFEIVWQDKRFDVLRAVWSEGGCQERHHFVMSADLDDARRFHEEVCRFASNVPNVVWVYARGHWSRSAELYAAIRSASFDDLVLAPSLDRVLLRDFRRFLASKDLYARYRAPHRRGALFVGPPGNGKTHAIRALLREIDLPVLYVKSLKARNTPENDSIAAVFDEARDRSPCVLVLEDLDALVTDETRSVFLNELDGFARNDGVITLATTNHPERLDPALLERPSRFDRKYYFDVPGQEERRRYLTRWRAKVEPDIRPSDAALERTIEKSEGFSFAYLQELVLAAMMRWIELLESGGDPPAMDSVLDDQLEALRRESRREAHVIAPST